MSQEEIEAAARWAIGRVADHLGDTRFLLQGIHASLPVSPREEIMHTGEEDPDFPTEARAVIECVLNDWIGPAIRDLKSLVVYPSEEEEGS